MSDIASHALLSLLPGLGLKSQGVNITYWVLCIMQVLNVII